MRVILLTICSLFIVPFVVYLVVKYATMGYYDGKRMWNHRYSDDAK